DDGAPAALEKPHGMLAPEKGAIEIHRHDPSPNHEIGVLDRAEGGDAGAVHEPVEVADGIVDGGDDAAPVLLAGDIEDMVDGSASREIGGDRNAAGTHDRLRGGGSDRAGRARDQYDFVLEASHRSVVAAARAATQG